MAKANNTQVETRDVDGSGALPLLCRIVHHHHGRTDYGNWISRSDVWDMLYNFTLLLHGERIGIQEDGSTPIAYKRGPWVNTEKITECGGSEA